MVADLGGTLSDSILSFISMLSAEMQLVNQHRSMGLQCQQHVLDTRPPSVPITAKTWKRTRGNGKKHSGVFILLTPVTPQSETVVFFTSGLVSKST